jgi:hypothetical protein
MYDVLERGELDVRGKNVLLRFRLVMYWWRDQGLS